MLGNNLVLKNVDNFEENMQVQYFLKNNTLLKTKQDISSVEEHVITYTLAKAQKKLIQIFDKKNVYNTSQFPSEIAVTISNDEIKSICDNRFYHGKTGLQKLCESLGSIRMNFVSYIDGYHTNTALIKSFKWSEDNPNEIIISIDKEVYLFLIDYTLNLKDSNIIIDEIKTPNGLKKKDTDNNTVIENAVFNVKEKSQYAKGYSRIELSFFKDIKNVYARNIFYDLKAAIENNKVYNSNINKVEKTYTIESLRERFMLENKYARFTDFNARVLKTIKAQINDSEYMVIDYTCQTKKARGGNKVVAVTFTATITEKLLSLDAKHNNTVIVPEKEQSNDTKISLAEELSNKVREGKLNVGVKTFAEFIDTYTESIVKRAVLALLTANEKEKIRAPKRWLLRTLEDMQTRENGYVVQQGGQSGINPMKFNNFEGRDYSKEEWDSMEKRLLGWDSDTENNNI